MAGLEIATNMVTNSTKILTYLPIGDLSFSASDQKMTSVFLKFKPWMVVIIILYVFLYPWIRDLLDLADICEHFYHPNYDIQGTDLNTPDSMPCSLWIVCRFVYIPQGY